MMLTLNAPRKLGHPAFLLSSTVMIVFVLGGCAVVVEDYAPDNVFGYATSGVHDTSETYTVNRFSCTTRLLPTEVAEVPTTAGTFLNTVSGQFTPAAGWSYASAASGLSAGSIRIKTYDAQGTPTRVGAEFHVEYRPATSDPSTNIHWIQIIDTNHSLKPPAGHGNSATYVDIPNAATTPYYDDGYAADSGACSPTCDLYDFPGRVDTTNDHNWEATTFLAQGPAVGAGAGAITFLTPGFRWGWINVCSPVFNFPGFIYAVDTPLQLVTLDGLEPGATVSFKIAEPAEPARIVIMKGEVKVPVDVQDVQLTLSIGQQIDQGGFYSLRVTEGSIQLGEHVFEDNQVGVSTGTVRSGNGYVHWDTGEASLRIETTIEAPEQPPLKMVFHGTAAVDLAAGTLDLQVDTKGIEQLPDEK